MADDRKRTNQITLRLTDRELLDLSRNAVLDDRPTADYVHFILRRSLYGTVGVRTSDCNESMGSAEQRVERTTMNDSQKTEERVETGRPRLTADDQAAIARIREDIKARATALHPLAVECLYDDECKTLMSKGHHGTAEFMAACEEWNGGPMSGWGKVRHVWLRNTPDSSGDYEFRVWPAEPHTRGSYPATTMLDDPAYDNDGVILGLQNLREEG